MLNIACVKAGRKYSAEAVNILHEMVLRNLPDGYPGRFVCFTDDGSGLAEGIAVEPLPPGLVGWWNKLALFRPEAFPAGDRVVYFDLDTVIIGKLDDIVKYDGEFAILGDFYRGSGWQSAVMSWRAGEMSYLWEDWDRAGRPLLAGGDQEWIEITAPRADIWQKLYPGSFVSYKAHCNPYPPRGTRVVCFHGEPKPADAPDQWVRDVYKLGGCQGFDLEVVCNTQAAQLARNIKRNSYRSVPWVETQPANDGDAVIVGGAPSLEPFLGEVRIRQMNKQKVFALNGAHNYLLAHGITPDACVVVDARPENVAFVQKPHAGVTYYLASQCDPSLFTAVMPYPTKLFHCLNEGMDTLLADLDRDLHLIGGGSTVMLKAMALAHALGYRRFHLYGVDSSYSGDAHHAYQQTLNDADRVLDVVAAGRSFKAAPWMIQQVNEFQDLAAVLANEGCIISVHGDGLLPHVAAVLASQSTEVTLIDGDLWPTTDTQARVAIMMTAHTLENSIRHCRARRVAVQAGGNCGVFPRYLAEQFDTVYTFEPDPLNFRCLTHNVRAENVVKFQCALGDENKKVGMRQVPENCGAHCIVPGNSIPVMRIDDLQLTACDLIQLDVEGFEMNALKGAERTIDEHKPVVCLELKNLAQRYGTTDEQIRSWLASKGYREVDAIANDCIFAAQ